VVDQPDLGIEESLGDAPSNGFLGFPGKARHIAQYLKPSGRPLHRNRVAEFFQLILHSIHVPVVLLRHGGQAWDYCLHFPVKRRMIPSMNDVVRLLKPHVGNPHQLPIECFMTDHAPVSLLYDTEYDNLRRYGVKAMVLRAFGRAYSKIPNDVQKYWPEIGGGPVRDAVMDQQLFGAPLKQGDSCGDAVLSSLARVAGWL